MKELARHDDSLRLLRVLAEQTLKTGSPAQLPEQGDRMLRELRLHELELRMQNDELQHLCEQVHISNERYVDLFMGAPIAYVVLDPQSRIVSANLAASALLGIEHARLQALKLSSFIDAEQTESFVRHMRSVLRSDETHSVELHLRLPDNSLREVRFESARDLRRPTEWRVAMIDLTNVRRLEHELERGRSLEAIGTFAAGVAHDFGNLLGLISTGVDLAVEVSAEPELAKPPLVRIQRAVREGRRMVRQLLRFSSDRREDAQVFALDAAISAMEPELRRLCSNQVELRLDLAAQDVLVRLDLGAPEEILLNLASNALYAMPKGGALIIETFITSDRDDSNVSRSGPRCAVLRVRDSGRGMNGETRRRAFEPFFTTRPGSSGTGLGLAMVHRIVTRAGGCVRLESEPGNGTTVVIELPVCEDMAATGHLT